MRCEQSSSRRAQPTAACASSDRPNDQGEGVPPGGRIAVRDLAPTRKVLSGDRDHFGRRLANPFAARSSPMSWVRSVTQVSGLDDEIIGSGGRGTARAAEPFSLSDCFASVDERMPAVRQHFNARKRKPRQAG